MGHVDHGKTLLLDKIRGTAVAAKEAGGITQAIGASIIPLDTIKSVCGSLLETLQLKLTIPGLLFIDTPGHAAFNNLRKRGGNLSDMAILVIDINEGLKPQTLECIEILKTYKTPFIIATNKIDMIQGWRQTKEPVLKCIASQSDYVQKTLDTKLYEIVGKIFEQGIEADRFDRVSDYTKQVAIVPTSAKTGDGVPELLMVLTGLAQRYLEKGLNIDVKGAVQGTVLEVKEERGLGKVMDVIIYDGSLKVNDTIVIGGLDKPIVTRVKALFLPAPLAEMREKRTKYQSVKEVSAATGVRIIAPDVEEVVSGMPLLGAGDSLEAAKSKAQEQVEEVVLETEAEGIVIKADSLGSLEALTFLLREKNIPVKKASIGPITKKDLSDAEAMVEKDPLKAVILGFNVPKPETVPESIKVMTNNVVYRLIEDYDAWQKEKRKALEMKEMDGLVHPAKVQLLKGYVFRQSNPAVVGVEVLGGNLHSNTSLMNLEGIELTTVKGIQLEQETISKAEKGKQVALSLPGVTVGRQIKEGDVLYTAVPEKDFRKFKEFKQYLSDDEKEVLKEIAVIMRKKNLVWGV